MLITINTNRWWVLDDKTKRKVYDTWKQASESKLGKLGSSNMYDADVYSLFPGKWLTDKAIMAFLNAASKEVGEVHGIKIFTLSTYLLTSIASNLNLARRWYRDVDMEQFDMWFIPINVDNMHWILLMLRIATHTIMVYDSLGKCNANEVDQIKEWLSLRSSHVWREIDATVSPEVPKQSNGSDCGVFTCMYALYEMMTSKCFLFTQGHTNDIREWMTWVLIKHYGFQFQNSIK